MPGGHGDLSIIPIITLGLYIHTHTKKTHARVHTLTHTYIHIHTTHTHAHTYTHTHTHTCTHMHAHTQHAYILHTCTYGKEKEKNHSVAWGKRGCGRWWERKKGGSLSREPSLLGEFQARNPSLKIQGDRSQGKTPRLAFWPVLFL